MYPRGEAKNDLKSSNAFMNFEKPKVEISENTMNFLWLFEWFFMFDEFILIESRKKSQDISIIITTDDLLIQIYE